MTSRDHVIHVVDADTRVRAELAHAAFALGHHTEVYAGLPELCERPPQRGVLLVRDDPKNGGFGELIEILSRKGIWLPFIAMGENPPIGRVVAAMKAGALDFFVLPLQSEQLNEKLEEIEGEIYAHGEARRRIVEARFRLENLSAREREVLDHLANGSSNKTIARELALSPRTVEIHRANMMAKLDAGHVAEAVRLYIDAGLPPVRAPLRAPLLKPITY